ncbi:MAG: fibronectin type III domain-containing protein [Minisyncoccales bacterium]
MNKLSKTILIALIAVFSAGLLINPVYATGGLAIQFEQDPLFNQANFLPGDSVTRWVMVSNMTGETQPIATEAVNYFGFPDPDAVPDDDLSRALLIVISEGGTDLYGGTTGEKTLFNFYQDGETHISDLANGAYTTYNFQITFPSEKEDEWQGKTTGFDILVGSQGEGTPPSPPGGGPGGGGGGLPRGLTIQHENTVCVSGTDAIITWLTSYNSTSRVIYDIQSGVFDLSELLNYGYTYSTVEEDTPANTNGVTGHTVEIIGLSPGTTYYFRCVSHASPPTIGTEHSFTTLALGEGDPCCEEREIKEEEKEEVPGEEEPPAEITPIEPGEEIVVAPGEAEAPTKEGEAEAAEETVIGPGEEGEVKEEEPTGLFGSLLASISDAFGEFAEKCYFCLPWWLILVLTLYPLTKILFAGQKKKKDFFSTAETANQKEKITWFGWLSFLVILALYCYFTNYICVEVWVFLILALLTILFRHFFFSEITGFKNNFNLILGLLIILIFFIVLLIIGCLPLWLLLLLLVIYFFAPDFFKRREATLRGQSS